MIMCIASTRRAHLELMFIFQEFTRNKGQFQWNNLKDLKGIYLELIKKKLTNFFYLMLEFLQIEINRDLNLLT